MASFLISKGTAIGGFCFEKRDANPHTPVTLCPFNSGRKRILSVSDLHSDSISSISSIVFFGAVMQFISITRSTTVTISFFRRIMIIFAVMSKTLPNRLSLHSQMTEASNSSPSLSLAGHSLDSSFTAVDVCSQNPESTIEDDADAEWMPSFMDYEFTKNHQHPAPEWNMKPQRRYMNKQFSSSSPGVRIYQSLPSRRNVLRYEPNSS